MIKPVKSGGHYSYLQQGINEVSLSEPAELSYHCELAQYSDDHKQCREAKNQVKYFVYSISEQLQMKSKIVKFLLRKISLLPQRPCGKYRERSRARPATNSVI